jgi:ADP-ribose pyrophosphatase YjhB (NUDIX family)
MVKHKIGNDEHYCLPGGGIEKGETPEQATVRELQEECCVSGEIIKKLSEYADPYDDSTVFYTYQVDIGNQIPALGTDPDVTGIPVLVGVRWMPLDEICERDRAYLWSAGLISIKQFAEELETWGDDISYPEKRNIC